jgi:hypothetical protein
MPPEPATDRRAARRVLRPAIGGLVAGLASMAVLAADTGQLLTNQFGELCTMCTATLVCGRDGGTTAFAFGTRTFLSQMTTVLDFFPGMSSFAKTHSRPVAITGPDGARSTGTARFDLNAARIALPDAAGRETWIDRRTGAWHAADGADIGACTVPAAKPAQPGPG